MPHHPRSSCGLTRPARRRRARRHPILRNTLAALLCLVTLEGVPPGGGTEPVPQVASLQARSTGSTALAALFDPRPMLGPEAGADRQGAPLGAALTPPEPRFAPPIATLAAAEPRSTEAAPPAETGRQAQVVEQVRALRASRVLRDTQVLRVTQVLRDTEVVRQAQIVPLPVARPADLIAAPVPQRLALRRAPRRVPEAVPAPTAETPSFFEELFAARKDPGPALAYAALESPGLERSRGRLFPSPDAGAGTAIYDITARTVRLPNGEVLEAHSGLGASMDHPDFVHLRMRGSTPPGTYDLTEREALFHGVRAIRLNPVGGAAAIHGRDGLLAHTYMLGPSGASNGCVSFRNYDRFLQAFLRGEIRRLVVVTGRGDGPARFAASR
ncbi:DUF2778 domain-containing protein [Methylobacterium sp. J-059]|uniref:DUF2778 domain-containing protein n=1 Tax=Methylobacterium sp. J-059 TaxID=2836643 RepID=UPI001FBA8342|nr:DUF2778 domain-containing protein [Methylobacterium sp. J-059]MCJ2038186.1 DUF2778 domain-containing protein [Methylobacterium sp. J-059]